MKIKSYFADTVEAAVKAARHEMGPDAMLLQTRKAPAEARHLGQYEVVLAAAPGEPQEPLPKAAGERLAREMAAMRRQLEAIRVALRSGLTAPGWLLPSSSLADVFSTLVAADVSTEMAQRIVERLRQHTGSDEAPDRAALDTALEAEIRRHFTSDPTLGREQEGPRIAALVGPPGSGKTTALVKLAVDYGLAARRSVQLLSLDTYRVAAAEQLRSYAAILGAAFQLVETPAALPQALEEHRGKALILIDTPGLALADLEGAAELARMLTLRPEIDIHLTLSASMKSADLTRVVEAFEIFRPAKLLFTRLDETESFGAIFCEAARTRKPLSFFGTGQRIPEDLVEADPRMLIDLMLRGEPARSRSAA